MKAFRPLIIISAAIFVTAVSSLYAGDNNARALLPPDGATVLLKPADSFIPVAVNGCVWDMSSADMSRDVLPVRFSWNSDNN